MKVCKLAKIVYTGTVDHIFDDSGENKFWRVHMGPYGGPKIVKIAKIAILARDTQL
jgi:hypothetical protein